MSEPAALLEPGYTLDPTVLEQARAMQVAMLEGGIERWSRSETFAANATFHSAAVLKLRRSLEMNAV